MVFVGTIESVVNDPKRDGIWYTRVSVEKAYKGVDPASKAVDLLAGSASHDCSYTLGKGYAGTKWLFYIEQPEQKYFYDAVTNKSEMSREKFIWESTCSRSRDVSKAADDLAVLDAPEKYKGKTRLSGTIANYDPSTNVVFRLIGNGASLSPTLHPSGYFEFFGFPPGQYTLEVDPPSGMVAYKTFMGGLLILEKQPIVNGFRHAIELTFKPGEHVGVDLQFFKSR
jgi:hypothetical protein